MRHEATDAERRIWSSLRDRRLAGHKFRRQVPIAGYIVDFYCLEQNLAVELDGGQHLDPAARERDRRRTEKLNGLGIRVLRFSDIDALRDTDAVLEEVLRHLEQNPHPNPLPQAGEGVGSSTQHPRPVIREREKNRARLPSPGIPGEGKGEGSTVRAFTLVELLVVIGIIALLAGLALPIIARVYRSGEKARTAADLVSIGSALEAYRGDFGDYPRVTSIDPSTGTPIAHTGAAVLGKALVGPGSQIDSTNFSPAFDSNKGYGAGASVFQAPSYFVCIADTSDPAGAQAPPGDTAHWLP
ncbi:MAG: DUF559 domain-containing protein, partial [Tepidisphaeraceae bacterium]